MPRFRAKPKVIEAVRFNGERPCDCEGVEMRSVVKDGERRWEVYNPLHDSWIQVKPGDYIRVDLEDDIYPIDGRYLKANYDRIEEDDAVLEHG